MFDFFFTVNIIGHNFAIYEWIVFKHGHNNTLDKSFKYTQLIMIMTHTQ
jgi:hypothetical protein